MKTHDKFREYIWLVNTIRKAGKISLQEINDKWLDTEMSEGVAMARSTFNRHKDAIEDMFGIYIDCDRRDGYKYYIGNADVLKENTVQNWMLSTLSVNNLISESMALQERILVEPVQSAGDYLRTVIDAMKRKVKVSALYKKYGAGEPKRFDFEPYCIKLFHQRWYVLGHFHREATEDKPERDYFTVFAFDRFEELNITETKFEINPEFSAKEYFGQSFGVFVGESMTAERVVIRAFGNQIYYQRDLPLHESQHEIGQGDNYADFELFVKPTSDLCGKLLSLTNQVQVIEPKWFADKMEQMLLDTLELYRQKK